MAAGKGKHVPVGAGESFQLGGLTQVVKFSSEDTDGASTPVEDNPGGLEGMTRELSALLASGAPDPGKFAEITARYDTEFLEAPQF